MSVLFLLAGAIVLRTTFNQPNQLLIWFHQDVPMCFLIDLGPAQRKNCSTLSLVWLIFSFLMMENRWSHYTFAKSPSPHFPTRPSC